MEAERLFVHTLDDLRRRVESEQEYDVLMLAGLLRKLILDGGNSLAIKVSRSRSLKLVFRINFCAPPRVQHYWCVGDDLDPEATCERNLTSVEVGLDTLLKTPVLASAEKVFTVREIIVQAANKEGAVHHDEPKDESAVAVKRTIGYLKLYDNRANDERKTEGFPIALILLRCIGRIVLAGLEPLRARVQPGYSPIKPKPPSVLMGSIEHVGRPPQNLEQALAEISARHRARLEGG